MYAYAIQAHYNRDHNLRYVTCMLMFTYVRDIYHVLGACLRPVVDVTTMYVAAMQANHIKDRNLSFVT